MNGRHINMADYLQEFATEIRDQQNAAEGRKQKEIVHEFLETMKPKGSAEESERAWQTLYNIGKISDEFQTDELVNHDIRKSFSESVFTGISGCVIFVEDKDDVTKAFDEFLKSKGL